MKKTIVVLRAKAGVGKTALMEMMKARQFPFLPERLRFMAQTGCAFLELTDVVGAVAAGTLREGVDRTIGHKFFLVADPCVHGAALVEACRGDYHIVYCWLVASPWLVDARRKIRCPDWPTSAWYASVRGQLPGLNDVEHAWGDYPDDPDVENVTLDVSDYPACEVARNEAEAIVTSMPSVPVFGEVSAQYQQAIRVKGEWHGTPDLARRQFEEERLDTVLPGDCAGLTVLDIGANGGGFCFEAVNRGAVYAIVADNEVPCMGVTQRLRTACQMPVSTCVLDMTGPHLPIFYRHGEPLRFGLSLLLNVLHHCRDETTVVSLLRRVLKASDRVVVETPFGLGEVPYRPAIPPYPDGLHLPPAWMRAQAQAHGFILEKMTLGPMLPDQRMIYHLRRVS